MGMTESWIWGSTRATELKEQFVSHFCGSHLASTRGPSPEEATMISSESAELYFFKFHSFNASAMHAVGSYHTVIDSRFFHDGSACEICRAPVPRGVSPMAAINDLELLPRPGGRLRDVICDTGSTTAFSPVHGYGLVGCFY